MTYKRKEVIGPHTLYLGDCLEVMPTLGRFDAVVTDPPYGVGLSAKNHKWFRQDGSGYSTFDDTQENISSVAVPAVTLAINSARSCAVTPGTECLYLYPKAADIGCIFNATGTGSGRWGFKCSTPVLFYGKDPYLSAGLGRRANSWKQPDRDHAEKVDHPCPKPLGLMRWIVNRVSFNGETILDPFMGSGTTGVACQKLGRVFTGIEIDPDYFDIACKRIEEAMRQPDLFIETPAKPEQLSINLEAAE